MTCPGYFGKKRHRERGIYSAAPAAMMVERNHLPPAISVSLRFRAPGEARTARHIRDLLPRTWDFFLFDAAL
jgi:hypothetical protein